MTAARHDRRSDNQLEDRPSVIASACLLLTAMLLEPTPKFGPRAFGQRMCSNAYNAGTCATVRADLPVFHEEVYTSPWPLEPSRAGSERTSAAHPLRERTE
jgi:hypothetical protein